MNLPNYFIADLPKDAAITPSLVADACQMLKRNREQYLVHYSTGQLLRVFDELGRSWLDPEYRFRQLALQAPPETTGFSQTTIAAGLDAFFAELTGDNLQALLAQDLGHAERLDQFITTEVQGKLIRSALVRGPELIGHVAAGNIPVAIMLQIVLGTLVRSAQFVKAASGGSLLPRLFAHSIYELEPKLGACLEIAEWPGGNMEMEAALFRETDTVTATGTDETLSAIRRRLPASIRFLGYGHRVSFAFVAREALSSFDLPHLIERAACDIAAWNQRGCLSPQVIYVEQGGRISAEQFAELLAAELGRRETIDPRGPIPTDEAALITTRRGFYEVRAAHSSETCLWCSPNSTAWTVVYESDTQFQFSCLNRFIYVKPAITLTAALEGCDAIRKQVSTVGLGAPESRAQGLASQLAQWGVPRICAIGRMQRPPLSWRHDGRPALGDLVHWTDWEH